MSHTVSADGAWQWSPGLNRWREVGESWDEEQIDWLNRNRPVNDPNQPPDPYESIELDEIELNTAEDAPLLESSAGATAAAPLVPIATDTVVAGATAALGAGIVAAGVTATALLSKKDSDTHKDPVVSLPGHHYIGPGNTISDTDPVDTDDAIARIHDIAYEHAKTQEDVQEADRHGASDFLTDAIHNSNPHSVLGYVGLKAKEHIESVVGVQYPANLPSSTFSGMGKRKYNPVQDPSRSSDFPTNTGQRRFAWDAWNRIRQAENLPRVDPPLRLGINTTNRPPINNRTGQRPTSLSISFREWKENHQEAEKQRLAGPLLAGFSLQAQQQNERHDHLLNTVNAEEISEEEQMEIEDIIRQAQGGSISLADFDKVDGAGPSNAQVETPPTEAPMPKRPSDAPQGGGSAPPNPAAAAGATTAAGTGHNSGSDGGFDSAQGPESVLPKGGYSSTSGMLSFSKVHRMKSWAIPYQSLNTNNIHNGANLVTTPLAQIPWQYAFYYLSPEEFELIPSGSYVDSVSISIMQTVASTAFPTGSSEATVATTNHPKVLVVGKDLEKTIRGGVNRVVNINSQMIPSFSGTALTENETYMHDQFIKFQYGTDQTEPNTSVVVPGVAHKIPFYNPCHFCIYQPSREQAKTRKFFDETDPPNPVISNVVAPGFEYFQNAITEVNANDTTWDHVDSMTYKFKHAPFGQQYRPLEILTNDVPQGVGQYLRYNGVRNITNLTPEGNTTFTETIRASTRNSLPLVTYKSAPIEKGCYFVKGDAAGIPARQPSYHIGMRAIDKKDPAVLAFRATEFVQANIEFEIKATMTIRLPSYPNRFVRPKAYNTSIENAVMGIQNYPDFGPERFVTFGLYNEVATAPAVAAVDQVGDEPIEDGAPIRGRIRGRAKRSMPEVSVRETRSKRGRV